MPYKELKDRQRMERETHGEFLGIRVHRALSWLNKAEQCVDDADSQVIFLWIAFNAAYANDIDLKYRPKEQELFYQFIDRLCKLDEKKMLDNLIWSEFSSNIRVLLGNKYVFQPFWDHLNDKLSEDDWKHRFTQAQSSAKKALSNKNTTKVLAIVLSRVYTLRNQVVHGGSTWGSRVNRDQVRDCSRFMGCLVPVVIEIMMDNPDVLWGQPCYPVV